MRGLFKLVGVFLAVFLLLIIATGIVSFIRRAWFVSDPSQQLHVRVLELTGVIFSASTLIQTLDEALENPKTRAIVLRVNSPGGVVAPSQELYHAFLKADAKVPVVVSMGSVAASGGYYVALAGRKVFANPGTLTGSIGVLMEFVNTQRLYQWAKIDRFSLTSGKYKDAGSPLKPMTQDEKALFKDMINDIYSQFRLAVKERRKLGDEKLNEVTDGRVLTGHQAFKAGLVDSLGTLQDAIAEAKALAKLDESAQVIYPEHSEGLLKKLFLGDSAEESLTEKISTWLGLADRVLADTTTQPSWRLFWLSPVQ